MNLCWKVRWAVLVLAVWAIAKAHSHSSSYFKDDPFLGMEYNADLLVSGPQSTAAHQIGRILLQERRNGTEGGQRNETYTPLVARNRIDPLNHFKRYKEGYDIKNKHYWASTVFTGAYGYAIAAAWIIAGVLYGIFFVVKYCCWNKNRKKGLHDEPHSNEYYIWQFRIIILLTIVAIISSGYVLAGNTRFHTRAKRIEKTILGAADMATETAHNVTSSMKTMQEELQPYDETAYESLNRTAQTLQMAALDIHNRVYANKHAVDIGLRILYITVTVLVSFNLGLVVSAVAVLFLHWRQVFYLIIFICSLLTTLSWLFFGFFYAIHIFADDSCLALKEYQDNPYNTTLNSILPCMDLEAADDTLAETRAGVHVLIGELNKNISRLQTSPISAIVNIPYVCDPFLGAPSYEYRPNECPNNTIQIGDIPD
ncbi:hypothetical protein KI387_001780, partial [Taxus chinensis]